MKKFLKILLMVIIALAIIILAGALFMPKETIISESVVIKAKPETVFEYVNCLQKSSTWSPWVGATDIKFSGPECGVGSIQQWVENGEPGKQEIIESRPNAYVKTALDFGKNGTANAEMILEPVDGGTKATWTFTSVNDYPIGRWIGALLVKPMLGKSYKKGLAKLDSVIMNLPPMPTTQSPNLVDVLSMTMVSIREKVKNEDIGPKMGEAYAAIYEFIGKNKLIPAGFPIALWHGWSDVDSDMECAAFVTGNAQSDKTVKVSKSYGGKAVVLDYYGAYDASPDGWKKIDEFISSHALIKNGIPWDEYVTDPGMEPDTAKWLTRLYQPVK
jgi:effector-binding domain-containing protein